MNFRDLTADEIEVRIQSVKYNKEASKCGVILLLYKNARVDMNILDETVGAENWQNKFYEHKGILFCSLGINTNYADHTAPDRWIWKDDAGVESNTEAEKGNASDARKRSGTVWGIGRELYTSPVIWVKAEDCKLVDTKKTDKYGQPILACYDKFVVENIRIENKKITGIHIYNVTQKKRCYTWVEAKK